MPDNFAGYDQPATVDKALRTREAGTVSGQAVEDQYVVDSDRAALIAAIQAIDDNLATQATLAVLNGKTPNETGTWAYSAGTSGTVNVPAGKKVLSIGAIATSSGATLTIDGGDSIPVPQNIGVEFSPRGNLVAPTLVFTATASYTVEFV